MNDQADVSRQAQTRRVGWLDRVLQTVSTITNILSLIAASGSITLFGLYVFDFLEIDVSLPTSDQPETAEPVTPSTTSTVSTTSEPLVNASIPTITTARTTTTVQVATSTVVPTRPVVIIEDSPDLFNSGDTGAWCSPVSRASNTGYEGDFMFTYAIGDQAESHDTSAEWNFTELDGNYTVEAWIPSEWATATVQYNIYSDLNQDLEYDDEEIIGSLFLDQAAGDEWRSLGEYQFTGNAMIKFRNSDSPNDYRTDGTVAARIAADAIKLTLLESVSDAETTTTTRAGDTVSDN